MPEKNPFKLIYEINMLGAMKKKLKGEGGNSKKINELSRLEADKLKELRPLLVGEYKTI